MSRLQYIKEADLQNGSNKPLVRDLTLRLKENYQSVKRIKNQSIVVQSEESSAIQLKRNNINPSQHTSKILAKHYKNASMPCNEYDKMSQPNSLSYFNQQTTANSKIPGQELFSVHSFEIQQINQFREASLNKLQSHMKDEAFYAPRQCPDITEEYKKVLQKNRQQALNIYNRYQGGNFKVQEKRMRQVSGRQKQSSRQPN